MTNKILRVGILCTKPEIPKWQFKCLSQLISTKGVDVTLIFCQAKSDQVSQHSRNLSSRVLKFVNRKNKFWKLYFDLAIQSRVSHFQPIDLSQAPFRFTEAHAVYEQKSDRISFSDTEIAKLQKLDFSVLISFDFDNLTGDILTLAPHGVWSYHFGDENVLRVLPTGFWEIFHNEPLNGLMLQRLTETVNTRYVLQNGYVPTERRSLKNSLEILFSTGHDWPAKLCVMILNDKKIPQKLSNPKAKIFNLPSDMTLLHFLGKLFLRNLKYLFTRYFMAERWCVGVLESSVHDLMSKPLSSMTPVWLPHLSANSFEADPFGYKHGGVYKILFEKFDYRSSLGSISSVSFDPKTKDFKEERPELEKDYHLSYPFIFEYQNEMYSLVENYTESKRNYLKLDRKTGRWETFIDVSSARMMNDQTLIEHEGLWYVFFTEGRYGANFNFKIGYSESPFGPFTDHLLNPIKIDIQSGRSAGPLFKFNGKLFRPCQNSIDGYGSRVRIYEVTRLTPTDYEEEYICEFKAPKSWGPFPGLHTVSNLGSDFTLIDCKSYEFIFSNFLKVLKNRFLR